MHEKNFHGSCFGKSIIKNTINYAFLIRYEPLNYFFVTIFDIYRITKDAFAAAKIRIK